MEFEQEFRDWLPRGLRAFTHYNRYKQRIMLENDSIGANVILKLLPLCLHINHPDLPGYVEDKGCPSGIKTMEWPPDAIRTIESHIGRKIMLGELQNYIPRQRLIEGLFTIGSVGCVAQTKKSDYDIWVVVDARAIGQSRLALLQRKLMMLERWICSRYFVEVHFFPMDILDIQANRFGQVSHEGAGSALKYILKEEFYRTMTLIEGRIPLWWVVPAGISLDNYERSFGLLHRLGAISADEFIDFGNIVAVPEQEFMGSALWQMHKAISDPLKSVLKMALVATYLEVDGAERGPLLCEKLKAGVFRASKNDIVDPYIEAFRGVETYYIEKGDLKTADLMRKCFYLKVAPDIKSSDLLKIGTRDKASIMSEVVKSWGWSLRTIEELNRFNDWSVEQYRRFGDEIHDYLMKTTVMLIRKAKGFLVNTSAEEDVEIEILRRRVQSVYVHKDSKIECEKRVKKDEPSYDQIYFAYTHGSWHIAYSAPQAKEGDYIKSAERVTTLVGWLVFNRRLSPSTSFHMIPNSSEVSLSDLQALMSELTGIIPSANSEGLDREALMEPAFYKTIMLVGNLEKGHHLEKLYDVDVLALNSWHELFSFHVPAAQINAWLRQNKRVESDIQVWMPGSQETKKLKLV